MAGFAFKNNLNKGVVLDLDELRVPPNAVLFLKNLTQNININAANASQSGGNKLTTSPIEGNSALTISGIASGTNYCIGFYSSETTNEGYFFLYNSAGSHSVWVVRGNTGAVQKVYQGNLLPFQLDPQYFIASGRCTMAEKSYIDPVSKLESNYKELIFTTNNGIQCFLSVEDSIATNSFSTSYFTSTAAFYNPIELIHLGVPTPLSNIGLNTPVAYAPVSSDLTKQNLLVRNGWQFRVKFIDIFGRESEHGIISSQYITVIGGGCLAASNGLPRCVTINFDAGNPLVNIIQVEYRKWVGNDVGDSLSTGWLLYEAFNKYDNSTSVKWYNRSINPIFTTTGSGITYNAGTNSIAYNFCADKNSIPISDTETTRTEPGLPRISGTASLIDKRLLLANNVRGFEPIPQSEVDKVVFSAQLPSTSPCPAPATRTITFYANIYNPYGDYSALIRTSFGKVVFGNSDDGNGCAGPGSHTSSFKLGQIFGDQTHPGFIAYIAGTPYKCISEQGDFDPATGAFTDKGYGSGISFPHQIMQKFTIIDVPAMKGVLRISSHKSTVNDSDYQQRSTYVAGVIPISTLTGGAYARQSYANTPDKEIAFDATAGDVNLSGPSDPMFIILDLGDGVTSGALDGYLYEQPGGAPVEMNPIEFGGITATGTIGDGFGSFFSDHNGFYFVTTGHGNPKIAIWSDFCDGSGTVHLFDLVGNTSSIQHGDGTNSNPGHCFGDDGNWRGQVYLATTYPVAARRTIVQKFFECGSPGVGVPGIPTIMTKGAAGITDGSGTVTLLAHNRYNYATSFGGSVPFLGNVPPNYSVSPYNQDVLIFSQKGSCQWADCGNCNSYIASPTITYVACTGSARNTNMPDINVTLQGVGLYGIQSGGKYPVAFWCFDEIGRHTAPQVREGALGFVDVPNLNDIGYQQFALCQIAVNIGSTFQVSPTFTKMAFLVGANVLFSDSFSWAADWVQPVDNTGATNYVNPTGIRIYYGSLLEYNKQNNFATNIWSGFITEEASGTAPQQGDIAQFIMNGIGTTNVGGTAWLPSVISAPITYDSSGLFFTIDYLPELISLTNGCLFRVIRPNANQSGQNVPLYEQCFVVDLVNGVPSTLSFTLPYFDSYLLSRLLPVPRLKGQPNAISPTVYPVTPLPIQYTSSNQDATLDTSGYSTNNINNANGVIIFDVIDDSSSFPFYFEGPSPNDLWGSHLACRGRVGVPNPYEEQLRTGTEVALSDAIGDRGVLNNISYFESQNIQIFDRNTWGSITSVLVETSVCMVICNSDHFMTRYNTSQLRVDGSGNVNAQNALGMFTAPERKNGENFGCIPQNINTIAKYAGTIVWLDAKGNMVFSNMGDSAPVEIVNGYQAYLLNKIATVNIANNNPGANGKTYFIGNVDPKTMEYFLTSFNIPVTGSPSYINTQTQPRLASNETLIFDLNSGMLKGFASFTPEYYGMIPGYYLQKQFLSFKGGLPYVHHGNFASTVTPPLYANFYGTQCEVRITHVVNSVDGKMLPDKVKRFLYNEIYCRQSIPGATGVMPSALWYADSIITEKGQNSRLLVPRWDLKDGLQCAAYLCALNTPADPNMPVQTGANAILDGDPLQGRWMTVSLTNNVLWAGTYFEVSEIVNYTNGIEKSAD